MRILVPIMLALLALSCKTRYVEVPVTVEVPKIHTEVMHDTVRDSVHTTDSVTVYTKGDTVYNDRVRTVYRWRDRVEVVKKNDTCTVVRPVEVPVPVEKELTRWQKSKMTLGEAVMAMLGGYLIYIMFRLYRKWRGKS